LWNAEDRSLEIWILTPSPLEVSAYVYPATSGHALLSILRANRCTAATAIHSLPTAPSQIKGATYERGRPRKRASGRFIGMPNPAHFSGIFACVPFRD
jgi:hypothetical protein